MLHIPKLDLYFGKQKKIFELLLKNSRFIIGVIPDSNRAAIYIDMKNESGEIIRRVIDIEDCIKRIEEMENKLDENYLIL